MMLTQTENRNTQNYRVTDNTTHWKEIDEKHRTRFNSNFVLCEEMYEISYIIQAILEFYPKLPRERITNAIYKSLREIPHPRLRREFWKSVSEKLDVYL
jgi:hypothetical protein